MKKIISFSLYGSAEKYTKGVTCNIELAKIIYPDWICRVYYGESVPKNVIDEIIKYSNVEIVFMDEGYDKISPKIWRFFPIDDDDVEVMLSRDADARLSYREKKCVDIFLVSDYTLHSIRDNISHNLIMAGMWGIKKNNKIIIKDLAIGYNGYEYDTDEKFLREVILPLYQDKLLTHCDYYLNNFPVKRTNDYFVGGIWPADNYGMPNNFVFF